MYNEDVTRTPANAEEMWQILREQFAFVENVLWDYPVEKKEDALNLTYRPKGPRSGALSVLRYRGTSQELDSLDYYREMGRELCPLVAQLLDEKKITPEFVQAWGKIMFCHGWIASHLFDDADALSQARGGKAGTKRRQREWVSRTILEFHDKGAKREVAEALTVEKIKNIRASKQYPKGYDDDFFKSLIAGDELISSYSSKHLSIKRMRSLIADSDTPKS